MAGSDISCSLVASPSPLANFNEMKKSIREFTWIVRNNEKPSVDSAKLGPLKLNKSFSRHVGCYAFPS